VVHDPAYQPLAAFRLAVLRSKFELPEAVFRFTAEFARL
jgi:hypothetical protein